MYYTVYRTVNKINGKIYIGKHITEEPEDSYLGSGKHLNNAIQKYGRENFVKEVLHIFDNEADMNAKEAELVTLDFIKEDTNYNLCPGGQGGFGYINTLDRTWSIKGMKINYTRTFSAEERNKTSQLMKDRINLGLTKSIVEFQHLSNTEEAIAKRKITYSKNKHSQGSNNSQYGSMWITNGQENKKIKNIDIIPEGWYKGRTLWKKNITLL